MARYADDFFFYSHPSCPVPSTSEVASPFADAFAPAAMSAARAFAAADENGLISELPAAPNPNPAHLRSGLQQGDPLSSLYHFLASASLAPWP